VDRRFRFYGRIRFQFRFLRRGILEEGALFLRLVGGLGGDDQSGTGQFEYGFLVVLRRALLAYAVLLAHFPERSKLVLHAFSGAQLFHAAPCTTGFAFLKRSGTTRAEFRGGFEFGSDPGTDLVDLLQKVGMLLNGKSSRQQVLKGLLIELQLWAGQGHENVGGTVLRTVMIIVQIG